MHKVEDKGKLIESPKSNLSVSCSKTANPFDQKDGLACFVSGKALFVHVRLGGLYIPVSLCPQPGAIVAEF